MPSPMPDAFVYLISDRAEYVMVGISGDVGARLVHLQSGNPRPLRIELLAGPVEREAASRVERRAHALLAEYRRAGGWFCAGVGETTEAIRQAQREEGVFAPEEGRALIEPAAVHVTNGDRPDLDSDGVEVLPDF